MFRDPRDPINDRPIIDDGLDDDFGGGGGGGIFYHLQMRTLLL